MVKGKRGKAVLVLFP